ncbi:tRNA uridine-5-carboxymethylaminomethyl(34) synthesis GTPase MnmE [Mangrovicella endophytica]|uniref:tRNA uridine-5-carboxymethylaminomethyl(34) synthesis GTPase MnmE n=1 Tax=Mangrovicella endophytica TaxID=2066697 RepID=UPI000C9E51EC|nr:tRNA uridine-5-carboxymethylaminomethyl(34) synthesis GTPase MnmE [Mangrovicella endophytica]
MNETIAALSSGTLPSGIAVLRVSGPAVADVLTALVGGVPAPRRASYRSIRDAVGALIDNGVVLYFDGPNSATGEDIAEFHLHGGRAVVAACLQAVTSVAGVRLAQAGEFTRRAFENGRIDLTAAEGLSDLLAAETEGQRRLALAEAAGALRMRFDGWMRRLTDIRAGIEAAFDFADEGDVGEDAATRSDSAVAALLAEMRDDLAGSHRGEIIREGYRVVLAGAPNAGKSSLLNALAGRDVAIVTPVPGTTRDVLEVTLDLGGLPVRIADTAGLRETRDEVEAIGIERAEAAVRQADLVLLLTDLADAADVGTAMTHVKQLRRLPGEPSSTEGATEVLLVETKADLDPSRVPSSGDGSAVHRISALTGLGIDALLADISQRAERAAGASGSSIPIQTRHRAVISEAAGLLEAYLASPHMPAEIAAETLRHTSMALGRLTGQVDVEDLLDVVFSRFCIGK